MENPDSSNKTLIIVLVVVALLLLCCCCVALVLAWNYGDAFVNALNDMGAVLPFFAAA